MRTHRVPVVVACGLLGAAACGAPSPRERFTTDVAPVLERRCLSTACHGVGPGAELAGEVLAAEGFYVDVDGRGRIVDLDAAYVASRQRIDTTERADHSTLLRKPLALEAGGLPHHGGHPFAGRDDATYEVLRAWVESEDEGGEDAALAALTPLQQQFARDVLPVLGDRGCMVARCHGPLVMFGGLSFEPPIDGTGGEYGAAQVIANYTAARHNLALTGDASRSRLLVKALPLDAGGILHRGGNDLFFPHVGDRDPRDDPGARAILAWIEAERVAAVAAGAADRPAGVVFVRGPIAPHGFDDLPAFRPGSDLWYYPSLEPGATARILTAAAHPGGPADVRDPAVSHDGTRIVFSMRTSADDCHNLYEIGLDGTGLRQLTSDAGWLPGGGKVVNRWPTYGPGGQIYFASTRAGLVDETARALDSDLYMLDGAGPIRLSSTPTPELSPSFLATGEFRGTLAFTVVRRTNGFDASVFRFPPDRAPEHPQADYHPHFGQTAPGEVTFGLRELPDGRNVAVLFDQDNAWEGGALAVIERQLGPDLTPAELDAVSVPGFRHAVSLVDPAATVSGTSAGGLYRDPAPLPDGRVVVAWAPGPVDLSDPASPTPPDTGLRLVSFVNDAQGAVTVAATLSLVDAAGVADDQPAVVMVRPEEDDPHPWAWDPAAATGRLHLAGGAVIAVIEQEIRPSGPKPIPAGIGAGIRLLLSPGTHPADAPDVDPAQVANGDPASTWWSNGAHGPVLLLAEAPLAPDTSIFVEAPALAPVRAQVLDPDGFSVGRQIGFWIFLPGGWKMTAGVPMGRYGFTCAGCHGAIDGDPDHALPPATEDDVDAISSASITLSSHQGRDRRRPVAPIALGTTPLPGFHFRRDLGPILTRSCAVGGCHAGAWPAGDLDLTPAPTPYYDRAYEALQAFGTGSTGGKAYVDERGSSAYGSYLMEKLTGRELGAPRALDFSCPPDGAGVPPLAPDEIAAFLRWIDLGAIYRTPGVAEPP